MIALTSESRRPLALNSVALGTSVISGYALLTIAITWPAAARVNTALVGNFIDCWQTTWGFWSFHRSLSTGVSPMTSTMLWWPVGVHLWFQTWDLPSVLATYPLSGLLSSPTLYNIAILASFPLAGFSAYLLNRTLWGGTLGPFLAGGLYTFSTFHFAHAIGQLHIASVYWSPLYLRAAVLTLRTGRPKHAALAGLWLGLATLASIYHLLFCVIMSLVLLVWNGRHVASRAMAMRLLRLGLAACALFSAAAGFLLLRMATEYMSGRYMSLHDSVHFSADIESFFVPNRVSLWGAVLHRPLDWTGNEYEVCSYIGGISLALAIAAWWKRASTRGLGLVAGVGALLALGPLLHVGGRMYAAPLLPEGWLERVMPMLTFGGLPARYSWLTTLGVTVSAGATLSVLCQKNGRGAVVAILLTLAAVTEHWPAPLPLGDVSSSAVFRAWSADKGDWAVVDGSSLGGALWHQMQHGHPIVAGYVTRTPEAAWLRVDANAVLRTVIGPPMFPSSAAAEVISPREALDVFHRVRIRYVILDAPRAALGSSLGLLLRYEGEGVVVFEVPESLDNRR